MDKEIISSDDFLLQDIICEVISKNKEKNVEYLYNEISQKTDIPNFEVSKKIFDLISKNKQILT